MAKKTCADCGLVSILIRPEGRMQHRCPSQSNPFCRVSILIRPEGRMQRSVDDDGVIEDTYVSILIRPEGRMQPTFGRRFRST